MTSISRILPFIILFISSVVITGCGGTGMGDPGMLFDQKGNNPEFNDDDQKESSDNLAVVSFSDASLNLKDSSSIEGDVAMTTSVTEVKGSSEASVDGTVYISEGNKISLSEGASFQNFQYLEDMEGVKTKYYTLSVEALAATPDYNYENLEESVTFERKNDLTVVNIEKDFKLKGIQSLRFVGGEDDYFIINVGGELSFEEDFKMTLEGGVTPDNILFNVYSNGKAINLKSSSELYGTYLALGREVKLTTKLVGAIVSGKKKIELSEDANIVAMPFSY
jgi:choice-of-anchor A domain-containing protein